MKINNLSYLWHYNNNNNIIIIINNYDNYY